MNNQQELKSIIYPNKDNYLLLYEEYVRPYELIGIDIPRNVRVNYVTPSRDLLRIKYDNMILRSRRIGKGYKNVTVCDRWKVENNGFNHFVKDMADDYYECINPFTGEPEVTTLDKDLFNLHKLEYCNRCIWLPITLNNALEHCYIPKDSLRYKHHTNKKTDYSFTSHITIKNKGIYLGVFPSQIQAWRAAYRAKAVYLMQLVMAYADRIPPKITRQISMRAVKLAKGHVLDGVDPFKKDGDINNGQYRNADALNKFMST